MAVLMSSSSIVVSPRIILHSTWDQEIERLRADVGKQRIVALAELAFSQGRSGPRTIYKKAVSAQTGETVLRMASAWEEWAELTPDHVPRFCTIFVRLEELCLSS